MTNLETETWLSPLLSVKGKPRLFQGLDETALQDILSYSVVKEYEGGKMLVHQGDNVWCVFILLDGHLRTFRTGKEGDEVTLRMLDQGESCMAATVFMGGNSPFAVEVTAKSRILEVPASFVKNFVLKDSQFSINMLKTLATHYESAIDQVDNISIKTPFQRIGHYLLQKHIEQGSNSMSFELGFKKATIASHLGMTPETFSRALKKIQKMGITVEGNKIKMRDAFALCHFCDLEIAKNCSQADKENCPHCHF